MEASWIAFRPAETRDAYRAEALRAVRLQSESRSEVDRALAAADAAAMEAHDAPEFDALCERCGKPWPCARFMAILGAFD
jgi:RNA polymerase-binding transcription factor DksA